MVRSFFAKFLENGRSLVAWSAPVWVLLAGCSDPEPRVYSVARETRVSSETMPGAGGTAESANLPPYRWEAPESWEPHPLTQFRIGSYRPYGERHDLVDISVTTFPGSGGDDLANVNRWRDQLELPHLTSQQLMEERQELPSGVGNLAFYDFTSERNLEANGQQRRRLGAAIYRDEVSNISWFFRISGADQAVETEMTDFKRLVASFETGSGVQQMSMPEPVHHHHAHAAPAPAAQVPQASGTDPVLTAVPTGSRLVEPSWTVPSLWQEYPAEGMRHANFRTVPSVEEGGVTVNVFRFPGDAGGLLENVNRWRGELDLAPLAAEELEESGTRMTVAGQAMFIVDLSAEQGEPVHRTLGAIFSHGGESWFVKMQGHHGAVQSNLQNFIDFLRSLKFPS